MKQKLITGINEIIKIKEFDESKICSILQRLIEESISFFTKELKINPIVNDSRTILIEKIPEEMGVDYGVKRLDKEVVFGEWLFNLRKSTKYNILLFLIIKESLMHFIKLPISTISKTIINFITILWIQRYFNIGNIENPLIVSINRNIYPETIAGRDYNDFVALLELLFRKNVDYSLVFNKLVEILKQQGKDEKVISNQFSTWVHQETIKDIDSIAPMLVSKYLVPIIDYLVEQGYENSKTSDLANILNKHENSIRKAVRKLSSTYYTFWKTVINYEKLKLHNYFLKITFDDKKEFDKIHDMLLEIPYIKTLYKGYSEKYSYLYSPTFISPHIITESLKERLMKYEKKDNIRSFSLQLVREKYHYATMISTKNELITNPNIDTIKKLLEDNHSGLPLKKYIFSQEVRDNSPIIDDEIPLDYNLLYFLSFLQQKYILSGSYGGWVHELPKLYEKNNLSSTNVEEVVDFLNQIEIRARRRDILSFSPFIKSPTNRGPNVLIFEMPLLKSIKDTADVVNKIRVFAFLAQFTLHDRLVFVLPGISHEHQVRDLISKKLEREGIDPSFYTINISKSRFVPLHDLYNYDDRKWL